ncbi:hypothetical protein ALP21_200299 [Pseudomonas savastanoi pv. phaseolicola]|uniref:Uncharacterized protein n=1 Tax=Pseudomonas savastanoi pv. phaseolicola TaxID=319 RepID=A0A7Z6Y9F3_PSESH|nr:hypothetical protein ALP21_200299 [Pseudomonas savastanoi pv. phaseolicola]
MEARESPTNTKPTAACLNTTPKNASTAKNSATTPPATALTSTPAASTASKTTASKSGATTNTNTTRGATWSRKSSASSAGRPSPTTAKTAWSKPRPWPTVRWKAPAATSTTAWAGALANSGRSRVRPTRNAFSGRDCGCCVKRVLGRAACTSTNPAAMRRSLVLISAKVRWRTGFITSTPTRSVRRWR